MMSLMRSVVRTGVSKSWTTTIATQHARPKGHANLPIQAGAPSGPVASPLIVTPRAIMARPSTTPVRSPVMTEKQRAHPGRTNPLAEVTSNARLC
jgi:hypothetical protein